MACMMVKYDYVKHSKCALLAMSSCMGKVLFVRVLHGVLWMCRENAFFYPQTVSVSLQNKHE